MMNSTNLAHYSLEGCCIGTAQFQKGHVTFFDSRLELCVGDNEGNLTSGLELEYDVLNAFRVVTARCDLCIFAPMDKVTSWAGENSFSIESSQQNSVTIVASLSGDSMHHFRNFVVPPLTAAHHERSCSRLRSASVHFTASGKKNLSPPAQSVHQQEVPAASVTRHGAAAPARAMSSSMTHSSSPVASAKTPSSPLANQSKHIVLPSPIKSIVDTSSPVMQRTGPADYSAARRRDAPPEMPPRNIRRNRQAETDLDDDDNLTISAIVLQRKKKQRLEKTAEPTDAAYDFSSVITGGANDEAKTKKKKKEPATSKTAKRVQIASEDQKNVAKPRAPSPSVMIKQSAQSCTKPARASIKSLTEKKACQQENHRETRPSAVLASAAAPAASRAQTEEPVIRSPTFLHRPDMLVMPTPRHGGSAAHLSATATSANKANPGRDNDKKQAQQLRSLIDDGLDDDDNLANFVKHVTTLVKSKKEARAREEKSRMTIDGGEVARCVAQLLSRFTQESQSRRGQVTAYYSKRYDDTIAGIQACKSAAHQMEKELSSVVSTMDKTLEALNHIKERMGLDMQRWDAAELMDCTAATASIQQKLLQLHSGEK